MNLATHRVRMMEQWSFIGPSDVVGVRDLMELIIQCNSK